MNWLSTLIQEKLKRLRSRMTMPNLAFGFDDVRRAIDLVERGVEEHRREATTAGHRALHAAIANPNHSFMENPVFAPMASEMWYAEQTFPMILRRSLFIAICSHVEHVLKRWCKLLEQTWSLKPRKKKAGETDLACCMRYLRDEAGLQLSDYELWDEWSKLDSYRIARNALTHDGGIVESDDHRAKVAKLPGFEVDDSGLLIEQDNIHLRLGACEAAAENAQAFLERLTRIYEADPRAK